MNFTADTCLKNGTCNQHCNQGRSCPRVAEHAAQVISKMETINQGAKVAHVGNVRRIHPHIHARDDAWLTTPGQLERTEDERTGRVLTVYDALGTTGQVVALLLTIIIVGIASGYAATRWGDTIAHHVWQALQAWGRVWT
jgi:hypothetical protein